MPQLTVVLGYQVSDGWFDAIIGIFDYTPKISAFETLAITAGLARLHFAEFATFASTAIATSSATAG